jgi:hypothetical protein
MPSANASQRGYQTLLMQLTKSSAASTRLLCFQLISSMLFLSMGTASVPTEVLCFLVSVPSVWDLLICAKHLFVDATLLWLRFLVAAAAVRDLLVCAKHLFVDARTSGELSPGLNTRHHHATKVE